MSTAIAFPESMHNRLKTLGFLRAILVLFVLMLPGLASAQGGTTRDAGNYTELLNAITASASGDIIRITGNIVVDAQVTIGKSLTIILYAFSICDFSII